MQLTEEQIKIRALGEEMNQKTRERFKPRESAQDIIVLSNLTKQQEDFILLRENE